MPYIEGVGYVNDATYIGETIGGVTLSSVKPFNEESEFNKVYKTEIAKVDADQTTGKKTYVLEDIFREASEKYGISESMLKALAFTESGFNATAVSSSGAMGMMQLMPVTARALGIEDAFDPYENIMGGAQILAEFKNMFNGDESLMLAAYNAGPNAVKQYGGIPPYEQTQALVSRVLSYMQSGVNPPETVTYDPATKQATSGAYSDYIALANNLKTQVTSAMINDTTELTTAQTLNSVGSALTASESSDTVSQVVQALSRDKYDTMVSYYQYLLEQLSGMNTSTSSLFSMDDDEDENSANDLFILSYLYNQIKRK